MAASSSVALGIADPSQAVSDSVSECEPLTSSTGGLTQARGLLLLSAAVSFGMEAPSDRGSESADTARAVR